jgi:tetratricopeptide (TPR) repeat protein
MTEDTVNPKAVQLLEKGIKAMQKKNYAQASTAFSSLLDKFPGDYALKDRAASMIRACERLTAPKPAEPTEGSEVLRLAVYHLNRAEFEEARALLDKAKRKPSIKPETTYTFAIYHALLGETDEALEFLAEAIELDESFKFTARTETDLAVLQELPRFQELVD